MGINLTDSQAEGIARYLVKMGKKTEFLEGLTLLTI
jgi:hypothetical protein